MIQHHQSDCNIHLKDISLTIKNKNEVIAKVELPKNRQFNIDINSDIPKFVKTVIKCSSWLWH